MSSSVSPVDMNLWLACMDILEQDIPAQQFKTWIQPLKAEIEGDCLVLLVANRFKLDWIRKQYLAPIQRILEQLLEQPVTVELRTIQRKRELPPAAAASGPVATAPASVKRTSAVARTRQAAAMQLLGDVMQQHPSLAQPASDKLARDGSAQMVKPAATYQEEAVPNDESIGFTGFQGSIGAAHSATSSATAKKLQTRLDRQRTFDNLVEGLANRMARAAAWHIAMQPGVEYNPLFIYGGVGLGKTHLLQAAGNKALEKNPTARVLYRHAEQFISDVVQAYQRKTFDELRENYAHLDVLLIDDVQFLAGKEKTQEEFLSVFESILARGGHIVLTGDTHPKSIKNMPDRLLSRLNAGFSVSIEPPDLDMRVDILRKKAETQGARLPDDVAFFVANNVRANVRELEGALQNILAHSRLVEGREINIPLVREALRDLLSIKNRQIGIENIQKIVADFYKIQVADMESKKRPVKIARPRQIAMYLSKELTQKSLPEIGAMFGGRDHSTVLHAVRKIAEEKEKNPELQQQLNILEQTIKG